MLAGMLEMAPLGKKTDYRSLYSPELLFPVERVGKRKLLGIEGRLPFVGSDIWNGYELSWLNPKGKPVISLARLIFPCDTPSLIESKSLKLYLNSFNQTKFENLEHVRATLERDLSQAAGGSVTALLSDDIPFGTLKGICLDGLDIETECYERNPDFLAASQAVVSETLVSHLLKSNCLATGQPDWGSIAIDYSGPKINREGLLKYIISYRNHSGFAEHCIEHMFVDIMERCAPESLALCLYYTRRGGLDINPVRSTHFFDPPVQRIQRQ